MEGISKFVLGKAGEDKDRYIIPENRCIRVEDVEVSNESIIHCRKSFLLLVFLIRIVILFQESIYKEKPSALIVSTIVF